MAMANKRVNFALFGKVYRKIQAHAYFKGNLISLRSVSLSESDWSYVVRGYIPYLTILQFNILQQKYKSQPCKVYKL